MSPWLTLFPLRTCGPWAAHERSGLRRHLPRDRSRQPGNWRSARHELRPRKRSTASNDLSSAQHSQAEPTLRLAWIVGGCVLGCFTSNNCDRARVRLLLRLEPRQLPSTRIGPLPGDLSHRRHACVADTAVRVPSQASSCSCQSIQSLYQAAA